MNTDELRFRPDMGIKTNIFDIGRVRIPIIPDLYSVLLPTYSTLPYRDNKVLHILTGIPR